MIQPIIEIKNSSQILKFFTDSFIQKIYQQLNMKIRSNHFKKDYDLSKAELIGQGNFAQVYRIFDSQLNDSLAIRKVKKTEADMEDINKEKVINEQLRKVQNQNILKIYDIIDNEEAVWYITQYCSGGSLWDVLNLCKDNKMNQKQCLQCVLQISKGVQQLHNHRITHRDLKPQNILLKTKYIQNKSLPVVKLADFGLSTQKIIMQTIAGTKQYIAPEQAKFHNYTNAVDVWSLGIICDEILHGTPFYSGQNNKQVFNKILKMPYRVRDQSIRVSIKNLLTSLLKKKPYERPIIAVIRKTIQKILQEIEAEILATKTQQMPKKRQSKDESFHSSTHSSNLNKYTNTLGIDSRKIQSKRIGQIGANGFNSIKQGAKDVKSPLKEMPGFKQVKQVKATETPLSARKQTYIPTSMLASHGIKTSREQKKQEPKKQEAKKQEAKKQQPRKQEPKKQELKKQEGRRQQPTKRQISVKKIETAPVTGTSVERPKQYSAIKTKQSRVQSTTAQKESSSYSGRQTNSNMGSNKIQDQKSEYKTEYSSQTKKQSSSLTKTVQNVQIPIYKIEKKKISVPINPVPKKQAIKCEQMQVSEYIQRLNQSKRQLETVTSIIKVQKIPSFLPNTSFTSQEFTVTVSQTAQCITQFKKQHDLLNFIQYNDDYDVNVYRKMVELDKNKNKSIKNIKVVSHQLKTEFMKQVDNYVEGFVQKILK